MTTVNYGKVQQVADFLGPLPVPAQTKPWDPQDLPPEPVQLGVRERAAHETAQQIATHLHPSYPALAARTRWELSKEKTIPKGAYRLWVSRECCCLHASDEAGFFAGTVTAAQLIIGELCDPLEIYDEPRFTYRGFMIDVARNFLEVPELYALIDIAAWHKLNVCHLHLVDDQGWRLEMDNVKRRIGDETDYTALHILGGASACQSGENPGFDEPEDALTEVNAANQGFESIGPGQIGYYTKTELKELKQYAAARGIQLVPELEFPGHNHVVLHALPHLATAGASAQVDRDGKVPPWTSWQVGHSYLDYDLPATWDFITQAILQVKDVFGTEVIHLGGDEAHQMMKRLGKERYLAVLNRIVKLAKMHGFSRVMLWQEACEVALGPNDVIECWSDNIGAQSWEEVTAQAKAQGYKLLNANAAHAYLDQKPNLKDPRGLTWACAKGLKVTDAYNWDPLKDFPLEVHSQIIGIEAPLWSETVRSLEDALYLQYPRLSALAEVAWSRPENLDWNGFQRRMRSLN
ncbi:hypothetical protein BK816_06125 [Boudabousia tangfeifanii]|uniref:beta-N-acetylhexosaminidase n=1 Tax=Boudabousia tangfeifanii TaxID=1912795 RepID=A0A1D9MKN9_9ACTO|nr:family 20 glycosylhydrolase [Boudabousia tangfeifanii]AOZ72921.1 hypothetical protein BK816_06125 [Boudabousia tangfeifanii]